MSIEQVKLIEEIIYYGIEVTHDMKDWISQIEDNEEINKIREYLKENHSRITQRDLELCLIDKCADAEIKKRGLDLSRLEYEIVKLMIIAGVVPEAQERTLNYLKTETQQMKMIEYLKQNPTASSLDVAYKTIEIINGE
jgi:hypothetical protein